MTTLKGGPKHVGGDFNCSCNKLTTLKGGPEEVLGNFDCSDNNLTTIDVTEMVGGEFNFENTPIYYLYEIFKKDINKFKSSLDFKYLRGTDIIKSRFLLACQEAGVKMPESIPGYNYI